MTDDAYGRIARTYARVFDPMNAATHAIARKMFPPRPGMKVLDVGCGTGAQLSGYATAGCMITGVDLSPAMFEEARARLGDDAALRLGDATDLPFEEASFDLVLASMFLHELAPDQRHRAMIEMARVMKADGKVLVTDFAPRPQTIKGHTLRALSWLIERAAGRDHFREFRRFVKGGGIPAVAPLAGITIESARQLAGANIAIYLGARS